MVVAKFISIIRTQHTGYITIQSLFITILGEIQNNITLIHKIKYKNNTRSIFKREIYIHYDYYTYDSSQ